MREEHEGQDVLTRQYRDAQSRHSLAWEAESLRRRYSYAVPSHAALELVASCAPIIELGAGLGYWAAQLTRAGVAVQAFDAAAPSDNEYTMGAAFHPVQLGGSEMLARRAGHTLFLCWPPREDPMAEQALATYRGERLLLVGPEREHASNAGNARFHARLAQHWSEQQRAELPPWPEPELRAHLRLLVRQ